MNNYYVYVLLDTSKPGTFTFGKSVFNYEPFYVGKGFGTRAESHFRNLDIRTEERTGKGKRISKILGSGKSVKVRVMKSGLSEEDSLRVETLFIRRIGRLCKKSGPLENIQKGGGSTRTSRASGELECKFYTYVLLDTTRPGSYKYGNYKPFDYEPFYVGKGANGRAVHHFSEVNLKRYPECRNNPRILDILSTGKSPIVYYVKRNISAETALATEVRLIKLIGRAQFYEGPLLNRSNGGPGCGKGKKLNKEQRLNQGKITTRIWDSFSEEKKKQITAKRVEATKITKENWTDKQRKFYRKKQSARVKLALSKESPEKKRARSSKYQATCAARTPEERAALNHTLSTARKAFFSGLTDKQYYRFQNKLTKKRLSTYESLSDKEKQQIHLNKCKGLSSYWASCSVEKRLQHSEAITAALLARGEHLEAKRKANISKALVKHNRDNPSKVKTRVAKSQVTKDLWTEEQFADFCNAVSLGHANRSDEDKRKSAKKKSKAGKLRAANETQEQKDRRSFALSRAQHSTWDGYTNEEREWRSQSLVAAYAKQSKRKKRRTADKISTSVALVHASRSIAEAERWATRISFTALLKHPTITPRIVKTVWSWYDSYDFENCTQIALRRRVIKYIFAQTGRVPVSTLPGLLDLNKLGKKSAQQLSVERSSNRKNKLTSMTIKETTAARSRTSLTLLYKISEIERCRKPLEQLFERTDFTVISQEQFKQNVLRTVYKRTGFKHTRLVI